jgi:hypothetical protein
MPTDLTLVLSVSYDKRRRTRSWRLLLLYAFTAVCLLAVLGPLLCSLLCGILDTLCENQDLARLWWVLVGAATGPTTHTLPSSLVQERIIECLVTANRSISRCGAIAIVRSQAQKATLWVGKAQVPGREKIKLGSQNAFH